MINATDHACWQGNEAPAAIVQLEAVLAEACRQRDDAIRRAEKAEEARDNNWKHREDMRRHRDRLETQVADLDRRLDQANAALSWYADHDNWTRNRPSGDLVSCVESGTLHVGDLRRPMIGLTVAILDMGRRARAALDLSPKPQSIDTSARDVDGGDGSAGAQADEIRRLRALCRDYEAVLADKRRNARKIDVALHGEDGAAKQPSLCDLVDAARAMRDCAEKAETALAKVRTMLRRFQWAGTTELSDGGYEACCPCCEWPERQSQHAPGCDLAAEIGTGVASREPLIGERQADDGMGGGHGG